MVVIIDLLGAFLSGLGMHIFYGPTHRLGERMGSLTRYAMGSLGILPFVIIVFKNIKNLESEELRLFLAYLVTFGAFGSGVFIGHAIDRLKEAE